MNLRIKNLQALLSSSECLVLENYFDLYYLTGLKLSNGQLYIAKDYFQLFVDGRYKFAAEKALPNFVSDLSEDKIVAYLKDKKCSFLAFDEEKSTYKQFLFLEKIAKKIGVASRATPSLTANLRMIKTKEEISLLHASAKLLKKAMDYTFSKIEEGISEKELASIFEVYALEHGAEKFSFDSIIAFGENSALPHHRASDRRLKKTDNILMDVGLIVEDYTSDRTRVFIQEHTNPVLKKIDQEVQEIHRQVLKKVKPGVKACELDEFARSLMQEKGYETLHSLGHSLGLEVHEFPRINKNTNPSVVLQENMVVTIEPGIYLPDIGGTRFEDMIVITNSGYVNLTN